MININKPNDAESFSAFAEIKTPDMFEPKRPVETSNGNSAFNVFSEMKTTDMFDSNRPPAVEETNSAFTAFSDMMGPAGIDLFKSNNNNNNNNNPDTLLGLVTKEVALAISLISIRNHKCFNKLASSADAITMSEILNYQ